MKTLIIFLFLSLSCNSQQVDKVAHFGVGYITTSTTSALLSKQSPLVNITVSLGTAVVIGTAKELYDLKVKKTAFNCKDLFWTVMGGASGIVTIRYTIRKTI
jgi:uncharacterized protein YfiM (DUF2279 family)